MITTTFANDVVESPESRLMTWFSSHGGMTSNLDLVQRDGKYHLVATDFISKGGLLMQVGRLLRRTLYRAPTSLEEDEQLLRTSKTSEYTISTNERLAVEYRISRKRLLVRGVLLVCLLLSFSISKTI